MTEFIRYIRRNFVLFCTMGTENIFRYTRLSDITEFDIYEFYCVILGFMHTYMIIWQGVSFILMEKARGLTDTPAPPIPAHLLLNVTRSESQMTRLGMQNARTNEQREFQTTDRQHCQPIIERHRNFQRISFFTDSLQGFTELI